MAFFPIVDDSEGAAGNLFKMKGATSGGGGTLVYFGCEDCATDESRMKAAGCEVQQSKFSIGEYDKISLCVDTEGNILDYIPLNKLKNDKRILQK